MVLVSKTEESNDVAALAASSVLEEANTTSVQANFVSLPSKPNFTIVWPAT